MRYIVIALLSLVLVACGESGIKNLKSPCAGVEGSPCGPKRPVNDWWQKADASSFIA